MTEKALLGRCKLIIVAEFSIEPNRKQFQFARKVQVNSLDLRVFQDVPAIPYYASSLDNIGENKQANAQLAAMTMSPFPRPSTWSMSNVTR